MFVSLLWLPASPMGASTGLLTITSDTTLTEDHQGLVIIAGSDLTLGCAGHAVSSQGPGGVGILVQGRSGVTVRDCLVRGFSDGIFLRSSSRCSLLNNVATANVVGLHLEFSTGGNLLRGNRAEANVVGLDLFESSQNRLEGNVAVANSREGFLLNGFGFAGTSGNVYEGNTARGNGFGFGALTASGNLFFHNNIVQNSLQVFSPTPGLNAWHHPGRLEGNFWSDYPGRDDGSGLGKHATAGDGIGDSNLPWPRTGFDAYPYIREDGWALIQVSVDIKPGSEVNPVNLSVPSITPVALLGSESFQVRGIDPTTLRFGPAMAAPIHDLTDAGVFEDHVQDVNGDGWLDLVSHYRTQETGIGAEDERACLAGRTNGSRDFRGCDVVSIVPRH